MCIKPRKFSWQTNQLLGVGRKSAIELKSKKIMGAYYNRKKLYH